MNKITKGLAIYCSFLALWGGTLQAAEPLEEVSKFIEALAGFPGSSDWKVDVAAMWRSKAVISSDLSDWHAYRTPAHERFLYGAGIGGMVGLGIAGLSALQNDGSAVSVPLLTLGGAGIGFGVAYCYMRDLWFKKCNVLQVLQLADLQRRIASLEPGEE